MADFPRIVVVDLDGAEALRYLKLGEDYYYGGTTHDDYRKTLPEHGPHVYRPLSGMLDLIASIANLNVGQGVCYTLQGTCSGRYDSQPIVREMRADVVARILDCDEQAVRDHFRQVVLIPKENARG